MKDKKFTYSLCRMSAQKVALLPSQTGCSEKGLLIKIPIDQW